MFRITIDIMQEWLDEIAESLPEELYRDLNGGILLLPEIKISPYAVKNDLFIMGEYVHHYPYGRMIKIYYGSIMRTHGHMPDFVIKSELRKVLHHEFIHHLESLAGDRSLENKDAEQLRRYLDK